MGMPSVNIAFKTKAAAAVKRSEKGVVALIIRDGAAADVLTLTGAEQVPTTLGAANQAYVKRAFLGYVTPPRLVMVYVLPADAENLTEALDYFATQVIDYLAGPPEVTEAECTAIVAWVKGRRLNDDAICKAVLPNTAADSEAVVNFITEGIKAGETVYTAAQYCSRIAGLLAGTPMKLSCTYAPLTEVSDVERLTKAEMDAAVDKGKLLLFHDGEKVKLGRGVNSLQTITADKGDAFKKIKIVEAMDMIGADVRMTVQDSYIGKYPNSYDSKCVLITAIKGYLEGLERSDILRAGGSSVGIDLERQEAYLKAHGVDPSKLSEQELKEADTGSEVFLTAVVKITDAIEDVDLTVFI